MLQNGTKSKEALREYNTTQNSIRQDKTRQDTPSVSGFVSERQIRFDLKETLNGSESKLNLAEKNTFALALLYFQTVRSVLLM